MEQVLKQRLTSPGIWSRALYMILFAIAYSIAETIIFFLVLFQFLAILFTGSANEPLLKFGTNMSRYVYQILQFQTFNTETQPFPFSDWPDEQAGGERWLDGPPAATQDEPAGTADDGDEADEADAPDSRSSHDRDENR